MSDDSRYFCPPSLVVWVTSEVTLDVAGGQN